MTPIQWLLIGGAAHGRTVWIKYGDRVACDGDLYEGENYLSQGAPYRIGVCRPTAAQRSEVPGLIATTGLVRIVGGLPWLY